MHQLTLDRWSRQTSWLHRRDARAKILAVFAFLILISSAPVAAPWMYLASAVVLAAVIVSVRLPLASMLLRAAIVIPLSLTFAALVALGGELAKAVALVARAYLSAMAALLLVGTTPLPKLLDGLRRLGVPKMIVLTAQFLYRYLFVLAEQAQHMRIAAASRSGGRTSRPVSLGRAAGSVAILFARSYGRAEGIFRAMLARGFEGEFRLLEPALFTAVDSAMLGCSLLACILLRWTLAP